MDLINENEAKAESPKTMQDLLNEAYDELREARLNLHQISQTELEARNVLKSEETEILVVGTTITGKNEKERDAQLRTATASQRGVVDRSVTEKTNTQLRMDLAQDQIHRLHWLIRADENDIFWHEEV